MSIVPALVEVANREWKRWGFSIRRLDGTSHIVGKEADAPCTAYVNDYWRVVGEPTWNGATPQPWSAAFISYCFHEAPAGTGFPYDSGHAGYCGKILTHPAKYPKLKLEDPASVVLAPGDVIWAGRAGGSCPRPPGDSAAAFRALRAGGWFCSHCDLVVAVRPGEVDAIGGNVQNSVTMTTFATNGGHIADPRHSWLGVIKNGL